VIDPVAWEATPIVRAPLSTSFDPLLKTNKATPAVVLPMVRVEQARLASSTVIVAPPIIVTVSEEPGTTPPVQEPVALQLPPDAVLLIAAAQAGLENKRKERKRKTTKKPKFLLVKIFLIFGKKLFSIAVNYIL
jgi:hypothetical protein